MALKLLSKTTYKEGIVKGVPDNFATSHKYGIFIKDEQTSESEKELHDCGIVYYPEHPYLLCVMTKGTDLSLLQTTIADISEKTYKVVDSFYKDESEE